MGGAATDHIDELARAATAAEAESIVHVHTVREVAALLRVSVSTVRNLIHGGQLPALRIGTRGGAYRVLDDDLRTFIEATKERAVLSPLTPPALPHPTVFRHVDLSRWRAARSGRGDRPRREGIAR